MDSIAAYYQPYFGNNQYLLDLVSQVEGTSCSTCVTSTGGLAPEAFKVPVKVWVYQNDQGFGGPTNATVEQYINLMNDRLRATNVSVRFYLKSNITRIQHTGYYEQIDGENPGLFVNYASTSMMVEHYDRSALNIHIIRVSRDKFSGRARRPDTTTPYSFTVCTDNRSLDETAGTMVHEAGHCFDLSHTHESARNSLAKTNSAASACYQEAVSRLRRQGFGCFGTLDQLKCSVNGDLLCDTDADPKLNNTNVGSNCVYTGGGSDRWGDGWTPPTRNIMSYSASNCRVQFTPMQRGVIYHYIKEYKTSWRFEPNGNGFTLIPPERRNNPTTFYQNPSVDAYENDNYWQQAKNIELDESQLHAFHAQPGSTDADIDWVRFTPATSSPVTIRTSSGGSAAQPNTRLTLFAADGVTVLASNDDISPTDKYSSIYMGSLTPGTVYLIRVENLSPYGTPEFTGQYRLNLFACFDQTFAAINGPYSICANSSGQFSVTGIPTYSNVTWTVSPTSAVSLSNTTGTSTTVTGSTSAYVTLTATVNYYGCKVNLTKNFSVGGASIAGTYSCRNCSSYGTVNTTNTVQPGTYTVTLASGDYSFTSSSSIPITKLSSNQVQFTLPSGQGLQIYATEINPSVGCGRTGFFVFYNSSYYYSYSPNPANSELLVERGETEFTNVNTQQPMTVSTNQGDSGIPKRENLEFTVEFYDNNGNLLSTQATKLNKLKIDVRPYKSGLYNLRIICNKDVQSKHIQLIH